jgi:hypothetical protein
MKAASQSKQSLVSCVSVSKISDSNHNNRLTLSSQEILSMSKAFSKQYKCTMPKNGPQKMASYIDVV